MSIFKNYRLLVIKYSLRGNFNYVIFLGVLNNSLYRKFPRIFRSVLFFSASSSTEITKRHRFTVHNYLFLPKKKHVQN